MPFRDDICHLIGKHPNNVKSMRQVGIQLVKQKIDDIFHVIEFFSLCCHYNVKSKRQVKASN